MTDNFLEISGINVQWPWSQLLLSRQKIIETRSYPLPDRYNGQWLALIETPGPKGRMEAGIECARIQGLIVFSTCFRYRDIGHWQSDFSSHLVPANDPLYTYSEAKAKWGWVVQGIVAFPMPQPAPLRKGIVFTNNCRVRVPENGELTLAIHN